MASRLPTPLPFEGPLLGAMPSKVGILAATAKDRVKARPMWCRCGAAVAPSQRASYLKG